MRSRSRSLCVAAGCAVGFATGWNAANVGAVAPGLAHAYGSSVAVIGLFTGGFYLAHSALQMPAGRLSDHFGARAIALVGLAIVIVFNLLALLTPRPTLGIGARIGCGIGTGLGFIGAIEYVRAIASPMALGLFGGVGTAAGAVALAVVPQLEPLVGWRAPFESAFVVALAGLGLMAAVPPVRHPRRVRPAVRIRTLARDRRLRAIAAVYAGTLGLSVIAGNWIVALLVRNGITSTSVAGLVASLTLLTGILTRPLGGWLSSRGARQTRTALVASIGAGAVGMLMLAAADTLALAIAGAVVVGLASGLPFAPAVAAATRARPDATGAAIGFINTLYAVTVLVGVPVLGATFALPGAGRIGFVVLALLWAACLLALPFALGESRRYQPDESVTSEAV